MKFIAKMESIGKDHSQHCLTCQIRWKHCRFGGTTQRLEYQIYQMYP